MKKCIKKILGMIPYLMLLISFILIIQVAISVNNGRNPSLFGRAIFFVVSPSMEDTIMTGDMIFVNMNEDHFVVGDIITFRQPTEESVIITHRIIEINEIDGVKYYTTQGDNNFMSFVLEEDFTDDYIIGKYVGKSSFLGSVYQGIFSRGINLVFFFIILAFIVIGGMELFSIITTLKQVKEKQLLEEKERLIKEEFERLKKERVKEKLEEGK